MVQRLLVFWKTLMFQAFLFDRYVFKNLGIATAFVAIVLAAIILLTQSLKFLELIFESGASSLAFWSLAFLALPRFFEVILPIAGMIGTIFIYHRMNSDSEIIVLRAAGVSPFKLARPALILSFGLTLLLIFISTWLAPTSLSSMNKMRQVIKTQYSTLIFREGVFNNIGNHLTVYIRNRNAQGELEGLLIHDSRPENDLPNTVLAKRGVILSSEEGQQVLVYDGSKQDINPKTGALNRLDFDRYAIDLPESEEMQARYQKSSERTFWELLHPDLNNERDVQNMNEFRIEAHQRIIGPFLAMTFSALSLCFLLLGPISRRGQSGRIIFAVTATIILQSLYLSVFNLAGVTNYGLILLYVIIFLPLIFALFVLSPWGEDLRRKILTVAQKRNS